MANAIKEAVEAGHLDAALRQLAGMPLGHVVAHSLRHHRVFQHELASVHVEGDDGQGRKFWIKRFVGAYSAWTYAAAGNLLTREAAAMATAKALGVPVPDYAVHDHPALDQSLLLSAHKEGRSLRSLAAAENLAMAADVLAIMANTSVPEGQEAACLPKMDLPQFVEGIGGLAAQTKDGLLEQCLHRAQALVATLPPAPSRLVHGDCHGGNWLLNGQRITALLDWEDAIIGDPRFDMGQMVRDLMAYERDARIAAFVDRYTAQTGIVIGEPENWVFLVNLRDYAAMVALRHLMLYGDAPPRTNMKSWLDFGAAATQGLQDDSRT